MTAVQPTQVSGDYYPIERQAEEREEPPMSHFECNRANMLKIALGITVAIGSMAGALPLKSNPTYFPLGLALYNSGGFGGAASAFLPWNRLRRIVVVSGGLAVMSYINYSMMDRLPELKTFFVVIQCISLAAAIISVTVFPRDRTAITNRVSSV